MENLFTQKSTKLLPPKLQRLLLQGKKAEALRLLENRLMMMEDCLILKVIFRKIED